MSRTGLTELSLVILLVGSCTDEKLTEITSVWAGLGATCATTIDGALWCWGANESMQLGDGTTIARVFPVKPSGGLRNVTFVSSGVVNTCAVQDARLLCWGLESGGDGGILSRQAVAEPTLQAVMPDPVAGAAAALGSKCALKTDGSAWCWGFDDFGSLGDGANADSGVPVPVSSMSSGVGFLLGTGSGMDALRDDGTVWGWGLVQGANLTAIPQVGSSVPVPIVRPDLAPVTGVRQLSGQGMWTCALGTDGEVSCWGGIPTDGVESMETDVAVAVDLSGVPMPIVEIAVGGSSICCLDSEGVVRCEGRNDHGQLGDDTRTHRFTMAPVQTLPKRATHIVSGTFHACAMLEDRTLWCWGRNRAGSLGVGDENDRLHPTQVRF